MSQNEGINIIPIIIQSKNRWQSNNKTPTTDEKIEP